jgi:hypothetical protein
VFSARDQLDRASVNVINRSPRSTRIETELPIAASVIAR